MKKLKLNNEIFADEEKFISTMTLLQASTGGGKSWAIRRILEQSFGKVPQIIIDTEGEFSTLREKYDYILIGKDYDISADPKTAAMMALRLWEEGVSAIIDIYELSPWDRQSFVKNFVDSMINAPKSLWNPVMLVIDEAHEYAPENDRTESGRAMHLLASKGRKRGIGVIFATQRISSLSKNVVAACKNKLIGYTSLDTDMKRANAELGFTSKDEAHVLRKLDSGEFYAFGPAISRDIIKFKIGDVQTTHGNHTGKSAKVAPASEKVKKALARLADIPQEAKKEADTIASLKDEVSKLKKLLLAKNGTFIEKKVIDQDAIKKVVADALNKKGREDVDRYNKLVKIFERINQLISPILADGIAMWNAIPPEQILSHSKTTYNDVVQASQFPKIFPPITNLSGKTLDEVIAPGKITEINEGVSTPEQKILNAIAWLNAIGVEAPESVAIALVAGYRPTSGGFANLKSMLRQKGLIDYGSGTAFLTESGKEVAMMPVGPFSNEEIHRMIKEKVSAPEWKMLEPILDSYPEALSLQDLSDRTGYSVSSGGFANLRSQLKSLGVIEYPTKGYVRARDILFPN